MTVTEFLLWEDEQAGLNEYLDGEVFAKPGATTTHNTIAGNVFSWLKQVLRGAPCRVFGAEMKLRIEAAGAIVCPDVFVSCDPRDREPDAELVQRYPQLVVEVLSDSTAAYDRGRNFEAYRSLETLSCYLLIEQHRMHADLFMRNADGLWVLYPIGPEDSISLTPFGAILPMAVVYDGVSFEDARR